MALDERRLQQNVNTVADRVAGACARVGREPDAVRLVAVTKYAELDWVRGLLRIGVTALGESRPQQLVERSDLLEERVDWHLIGHLQRNKVRAVLPHVRMIHSVDSSALLQRIDRISGELGRITNVFLQVNVSGESTKDGFAPIALKREYPEVTQFQNVAIVGLMTMAPLGKDAESARDTFRGLRELRDQLRDQVVDGPSLDELSMGMSHDFEVAVEEGATFIRIGSLLYDGLARSDDA